MTTCKRGHPQTQENTRQYGRRTVCVICKRIMSARYNRALRQRLKLPNFSDDSRDRFMLPEAAATFEEIGRAIGVSAKMAQQYYRQAVYKLLKNPTGFDALRQLVTMKRAMIDRREAWEPDHHWRRRVIHSEGAESMQFQ